MGSPPDRGGDRRAAADLPVRGGGGCEPSPPRLRSLSGVDAVAVAEGSAIVAYNPFTDIGGHWAEEDILKAYHAGLFQGVTETTFVPRGS